MDTDRHILSFVGRSSGVFLDFEKNLKITCNTQGLKCMEGRAQNGTKDDFKSVTCEPGETWCFEVHTKDKGRPVEDFKSCWDPNWDDGMYEIFLEKMLTPTLFPSQIQ